MDDVNFLPGDLKECQRLLLAAFGEAKKLERRAKDSERVATEIGRILEETATSYDELKRSHQAALNEINRLKQWIYGRRRERIVEGEGQQHLFDLESPSNSNVSDELRQERPQQQVAAHSRRARRALDLSKLPHYRHELSLIPEEKTCESCGRARDQIGHDETRILEFVPAKLEVHVYVRPKFACRYCKDRVVSPPPPARPIARGIAGPGLIAQIVVSKFGDHLPLYRQEDYFARCGLHIPRSTQCDWVRAAAELLRPLYEHLKQLVLQSPVLWTDDTTVTVLTGDEQGSRTARFWTYIAEEHPYTVYDFTDTRSRDGPANFLAGFEGYLHADAYVGYDRIYLGSDNRVIEVACWTHARRKFFEARHDEPKDAHQILEWVRQLYAIETRAHDLSVASRQELRAVEAIPVLDRIETYLQEWQERVLPKSDIALAIGYALNQWQALRRYTEDGRLSIDNNVSERTLRHQAIGRKNWLFLGGPQAGPRAAVLYSILHSAKRHHVEPWAYLQDLLLRLHGDDDRLDEMLPDRWIVEHPQCKLDHRLEEKRQKAAAAKARRQHRLIARRPK
jgi:transposase